VSEKNWRWKGKATGRKVPGKQKKHRARLGEHPKLRTGRRTGGKGHAGSGTTRTGGKKIQRN